MRTYRQLICNGGKLLESKEVYSRQRLIVENKLRVRFGSLDRAIEGVIEPMLDLPPEELGTSRFCNLSYLPGKGEAFGLHSYWFDAEIYCPNAIAPTVLLQKWDAPMQSG